MIICCATFHENCFKLTSGLTQWKQKNSHVIRFRRIFSFQLLLGKNRLFNDWIVQEMAPHSIGGTTLLHKSVLPITMIFSMISFLEKSY